MQSYEQYNPSDSTGSGKPTVSNNGRTITYGSGSNNNIRGYHNWPAGQIYFEGKFNQAGTGGNAEFGVGNASLNLAATNFFGKDTNGVGFADDGKIYFNNTTTVYGSAIVSGDVIGMAIDSTLSPPKVWCKNITQGTGWNNGTITNQNPAVGSQVGGVSCTSLTGNLFIGGNCSVSGANITINCGQAALAQSIPAGFSLPPAPIASILQSSGPLGSNFVSPAPAYSAGTQTQKITAVATAATPTNAPPIPVLLTPQPGMPSYLAGTRVQVQNSTTTMAPAPTNAPPVQPLFAPPAAPPAYPIGTQVQVQDYTTTMAPTPSRAPPVQPLWAPPGAPPAYPTGTRVQVQNYTTTMAPTPSVAPPVQPLFAPPAAPPAYPAGTQTRVQDYTTTMAPTPSSAPAMQPLWAPPAAPPAYSVVTQTNPFVDATPTIAPAIQPLWTPPAAPPACSAWTTVQDARVFMAPASNYAPAIQPLWTPPAAPPAYPAGTQVQDARVFMALASNYAPAIQSLWAPPGLPPAWSTITQTEIVTAAAAGTPTSTNAPPIPVLLTPQLPMPAYPYGTTVQSATVFMAPTSSNAPGIQPLFAPPGAPPAYPAGTTVQVQDGTTTQSPSPNRAPPIQPLWAPPAAPPAYSTMTQTNPFVDATPTIAPPIQPLWTPPAAPPAYPTGTTVQDARVFMAIASNYAPAIQPLWAPPASPPAYPAGTQVQDARVFMATTPTAAPLAQVIYVQSPLSFVPPMVVNAPIIPPGQPGGAPTPNIAPPWMQGVPVIQAYFGPWNVASLVGSAATAYIGSTTSVGPVGQFQISGPSIQFLFGTDEVGICFPVYGIRFRTG